jgi:uncharacterized protein (TIGR03089 family)
VTFYDDETGERVELSVLTYANWVAKTAGLLQDELGLERGDSLLLDLPTHWLGPVWLGAAWSLGIAVTPDPLPVGEVDLVVCGPDGLSRYAGADLPASTPTPPVVALSLLPLGARFSTPLPPGVVDYGAVVWGQPDVVVAYEEPEPEDPGWRSGEVVVTQAELLASAASGAFGGPGARPMTDANPASPDGLGCFLGPLLGGGGTVWVASPSPGRWDDRGVSEQVTDALRTTPAAPGPEVGQPRS